jgi:integrase
MALKFARLTRPNIRALKPGEKITEHGITAERLADGDLKYNVNIMVDRQRVHRVIGRDSEGVTRKQAEKFIEKARTEAREGRLGLPVGRKTPLGFSTAADYYVKRLKEDGGQNIRQKRGHLANHLKPFLKTQNLASITTFTIGSYKRHRAGQGGALGSINRELTTLSHLFSMAVEWKWLKERPCEVKKDRETAGRFTVLSDEQADDLLRGAMRDEDTYCWLFVMFGLNSGMRHAEILRARFDNLDIDNLRLFIPQAKAGQREQPITQELADTLEREREGRDDQDGWIFPAVRPNLSIKGHRTRMDRSFRRSVIRAGLDPAKVTPHVMRHTAITNLVQSGADLPTIQRISGHKTLSKVMRYTHVHGQHIDRAIKAIGRALPEPSENENAGTVTPKLHTAPKRPA